MKNLTGDEQRKILSNNLRFYMQRRDINQTELAQRLGIGLSTVAEWYHGRKYPRPDNLQKIADILGVYMSDLREPMNKKGNYKPAVAVPVLGSIPAGIPLEAIEDIVDYEEISEGMAKGGEFMALRIKGDSMEPRIREGDVVIIRRQEHVENGEIAVVMINGNDATLKKFFANDNGVTLIGTNPAFEPLTYTPEQVEQLPVRVLGKVVELRAKF